MGIDYLAEIERIQLRTGSFLNWKSISRFDSVGRPLKYRFKRIGKFSPTFLRYSKTILEFEDFFDAKSFKNVCEIGVGFGGQAGLILDRWAPESYTLYDLPEVLHLVEKYLIKIGKINESKIILANGRNPEFGKFDFVFSNYAFSELDKATQDAYLHNIILNSRHGYITWNNLGHFYNGAYSLGDLIRLIPKSQIVPETPLTSKYNSVIQW
jgi:putative sugar O-methyltransferase